MLLAGAALQGALLYIVGLGDLRTQVPLFWLGLAVAFAAYGVAWWLLGRSVGGLRLVLGLAVVFRVTMLFSPPSLSDDIYRYVWDGRQQLAGINPYVHPPEDAAVAHLRDGLYQGINNKHIPTIYPPLAQLFFRAVCYVEADLWAMKLGLTLCDLALVCLLVLIFRRRGDDPRRTLIYAWHPLPLVEVAGSGHLDVLGVLCVFLALYWLEGGRRAGAVVALGLGFLVKLLPVLLLPAFWRALGPTGGLAPWLQWRGRLVLGWFGAVVVVGYLPFADAGGQLFAALQTYVLKWRFNDAFFSVVYGALKEPGGEWDDGALQMAKICCALVLVGAVAWSMGRRPDPYDAAFVALGAYLLVSPTLHPWYLLWVMPFLALRPRLAWMLLSGLVFLAYEVLIIYSKSGVWEEKSWVLWVEFGPFYAVWAWQMWSRWARRRGLGAVSEQ